MERHILSVPALASGAGNEGGIIILVMMAVFVLVVGWILVRNNNANKETESASKPPVAPIAAPVKSRTEKEAAEPIAHKEYVEEETIDEKFARYNRMWVCAYCETLNRCLPGDVLLSERTMPAKETVAVPQGTLRGNLLKRTAAGPGSNPHPECIACGKRRIRHI